MLSGKRILLGVCGGIAAYRACELSRLLLKAGAEVQVVLTPAAAQFVTPLTFTALTGKPAWVSEFEVASHQSPVAGRDEIEESVRTGISSALTGEDTDGDPLATAEEDKLPAGPYLHLDLTREIDCFVIAPATAGTIGKLASGVADNLLTSAYLSCTAPVVIAPAMNVRMWEHVAVRENTEALRRRGHAIVEPGTGDLACGDVGAGRLAEVEEIVGAVGRSVGGAGNSVHNLEAARNGRANIGRVIVTAGGTREYLDPVRFITNNSTGAFGVELCRALLRRSAAVELIDTGIDVPSELEDVLGGRQSTATAFDLQSALQRSLPEADALVMLAAVADYGPTRYSSTKRKKDGAAWTVELAETPDVLKSIAPLKRPGQVFIGVSLEDTDWLRRAQSKCAAKGCDAMLAVELTGELPYGERRMHCALISSDTIIEPPALRSKPEAATMLADWLIPRLGGARIEQAGQPATQSV